MISWLLIDLSLITVCIKCSFFHLCLSIAQPVKGAQKYYQKSPTGLSPCLDLDAISIRYRPAVTFTFDL